MEQERRKTEPMERETWALDYSFHLWLYERLKRFVDVCGIDLDYHKFEYNGNEYTQRQLVDMMLERLEFSFKPEYNDFDEAQYNYVSEIEKFGQLYCLLCGGKRLVL